MRRISRDQARRIAVRAQGLGGTRPDRAITTRDVQGQISRLGQFQIDSVNVLTRAHYFPLFSRLGSYDPSLLDRAWGRAPRRMTEYWGHAASLIDVELMPALHWRKQRHREQTDSLDGIRAAHPGLVERVLDEVGRRGPLTARDIDHAEERDRSHWGWNWSAVKTCLEHLYSSGDLAVAGRNGQFERLYDLPEKVMPVTEPLTEAEQHLMLVSRAARALGVFSQACVADYFYLRRAPVQQALAELESSGQIEPVQVEGWSVPAWLWQPTTIPRQVTGRALLSPFDSMMFQRDRIEALFDYFYRIEIYVPAAKRQYGYYVYSFLLGDRIVARVDLKADRVRGVLLVQSAWFEQVEFDRHGEVSAHLAAELTTLAQWQNCSQIEVRPVGDAAAALGAALRQGSDPQD